MSAKTSYDKVIQLMKEHHIWFDKSIPLIASENIPSPAVREALMSDFGNRYAEGWPGERVYAGCIYIDQVELICNDLARRVFRAEFADCRATSGVVANLAIYAAFSSPGDWMMAASIPSGGHISHGKKEHSGTAGLVHGLYINYDGAHVAGLIAGGEFQDPLREGADSITMSSHKTLWGPQGGCIVSYAKHAENIKKAIFPGNTSSHHLHHVAGKAIALAESLEFGKAYAKQVIRNAKALAEALAGYGFRLLGEKNGYTASHQIAVDVTKFGDGGTIEEQLEKAGIILNRQLLPGDIKAGRHYMHPSGVRIGVPETTRLGMKESEMKEIANFIKRVIVEKQDPGIVRKDVADFRKQFQKVHYAFDNAIGAYEYISLTGNGKK